MLEFWLSCEVPLPIIVSRGEHQGLDHSKGCGDAKKEKKKGHQIMMTSCVRSTRKQINQKHTRASALALPLSPEVVHTHTCMKNTHTHARAVTLTASHATQTVRTATRINRPMKRLSAHSSLWTLLLSFYVRGDILQAARAALL